MVLESRLLEFGSKLPHRAPKVTCFLGYPFELDMRAYIDLYVKAMDPQGHPGVGSFITNI